MPRNRKSVVTIQHLVLQGHARRGQRQREEDSRCRFGTTKAITPEPVATVARRLRAVAGPRKGGVAR